MKLASRIIVAIIIVCNFIPTSQIYYKVIKRNSTKEFIKTKENTYLGIEIAKSLGKKNIGVHIELYYEYNWHINPKGTSNVVIYSITPNEPIPELDFYIEPINSNIKLKKPLFSKSRIANEVKYYYNQ